MFKNEKYNGEIWVNSPNDRFFCTLEKTGNEFFLTTNLTSDYPEYKKPIIYGEFVGLGFLTFVNNLIHTQSTGIIVYRIYSPEYIFISEQSLFDPHEISFKQFIVESSFFNKWIRSIHFYDSIKKEVEFESDIYKSISLNELTMSIFKSFKTSWNVEGLKIENYGNVEFINSEKFTLVGAIEMFNIFQKFIMIYSGNVEQFKIWKFKHIESQNWIYVHYKDNFIKRKTDPKINLDYKEIENELDEIFKNWFKNQDIQYCIDILIESMFLTTISYRRKFVNSLSLLEAYYKRFNQKKGQPKLNNILTENKNVFMKIIENKAFDFDDYVKKIIQGRDYLVHGNKQQQLKFTDFDLLYESLLIEYVVLIKISELIGFSEKTINKIYMQATKVYEGFKSTNKFLNENTIIK